MAGRWEEERPVAYRKVQNRCGSECKRLQLNVSSCCEPWRALGETVRINPGQKVALHVSVESARAGGLGTERPVRDTGQRGGALLCEGQETERRGRAAGE